MPSIKNITKLALSIIFCESAGILGSVFTIPNISTWYQTLNKPAFTPPNWVFGPVWTTLYFLMGVSLYLIISKKKNISIFLVQLFLNFLWSVIFFGGQSLFGGLIIIGMLWIAIFLTIISFYKTSKLAGILLIPYLMWVTIASILNFSVYLLNRG